MAPDSTLRVELFVDDVERSAAFYERVRGFAREHESPGYIAVRYGDVRIGIGAAAGLPQDHYFGAVSLRGRKGIGVELVVEVNDVDSALRQVTEVGHPIISPLRDRPWGLRDFRIADPDGYYLRISSR